MSDAHEVPSPALPTDASAPDAVVTADATTPAPATNAAAATDAASGMGRRALLKVLATTAVALPVLGSVAGCAPERAADGAATGGAASTDGEPKAGPRGTPTDPELLRPKVTWPMQLTPAELVTLTALCDMIIPADDKSPAASAVGVPAYINEYVSAPAESYRKALVQVRGGLVWLNVESGRRFGKDFHAITTAQRTAICDDICYAPKAKPEHKQAAAFFDKVRALTAEGFYTTDAGMKDVGYVGNVALKSFDGPPPEVLKHLGLA